MVKVKHNCFCEGNRFSKLNNYRQVVIGEEQLEVLGVNVIEEVSDFLIHHVAELGYWVIGFNDVAPRNCASDIQAKEILSTVTLIPR